MWHRVSLFSEFTNIDVIGFFDDDKDTAEKFEQRTGFRRYGSAEELLADSPDMIFVESMDVKTPYYAQIAASVAKGILIEKVGAVSPELVRDLEKQLSEYPVYIENGFQMRYLPIVEKCSEILGSGALGNCTLARFHGGCPSGCAADPWCNEAELSSGLVWLEGSHILDISIELLGMPKAVKGMLARLPESRDIVSRTVGMDLFKGAGEPVKTRIGTLNHEDVGAAIALYDDMMAVFDFTAWESGGWCEEWKMEFYGTNGTLTAWLLPEIIELKLDKPFGSYPSGGLRISYPLKTEAGDSQMRDAYRRQLIHFAEMVSKHGQTDQSSMHRMSEVARLAEMMY